MESAEPNEPTKRRNEAVLRFAAKRGDTERQPSAPKIDW
jgi:hypothetical protein